MITNPLRDSDKTKPLFEKSITYIEEVLDKGIVEDQKVIDVALRAFVGHLKARNTDQNHDALTFMINKTVLPDPEQLKAAVRKSLPEYAEE